MRKLAVLLALVVLTTACTASLAPEPSPTSPPPLAEPATAEATTAAPAHTAQAGVATQPAPDTSTPLPTTPTTPSPAAPTVAPMAEPPQPGSPWPAYLRTLDLRLPAGNSYGPRTLAAHPSEPHLYARTHSREGTGRVAMLDPAGGQVQRTAQTGPDEYSTGELVVDEVRSRVLAVNPDDQTLTALDAAGLGPVATVKGVEHLALDAAGGVVYVTAPGDVMPSIRALDAASYEVLRETTRTNGPQALAMAVNPALGRLYIALRSNVYLLGMWDTATMQVWTTAPLPGPPDGLLVDPGSGRVYYSGDDGTNALLLILDDEGAVLHQVELGEWTQDAPLALDAAGGRLFVGWNVYQGYGVHVLNAETGETLAEIPLSEAPNALTWDAATRRLWVSHTYSDRISAIDVDARRVTGTYPTALGLSDVEVDPGLGRLLAADTMDRVHVLEEESGRELALLPGGSRLAVDAPHGRFYSGGYGSERVTVYDSDLLEPVGEIQKEGVPVADAHSGGLYVVNEGIYLTSLETMTVTGAISDTLPQSPGYSPNPAAVDATVDPGSGRILAIISNGVPGSNGGTYLYVYEPVTYEKVLTDTERSPMHVDVDPATGRAWVSRAHLAGRSTSLLVDGRTYTDRVNSLFGALRVDPGLGKLYVAVGGERQGQLYVLDAATLDVLGAVPIDGGYTLAALDPDRHWLFLATEEGLVQVWSATGGALPAPQEPVPADLGAAGPVQLYLPPGAGPLFALDAGRRLYRSADGSAWGRLAGGLPDAVVTDLAFGGALLFAGVSSGDEGHGVWRSDDGGLSWRSASAGLTDLAVLSLDPSPGFAQDQTLFAAANRGGLYRSTDAGQRWVGLSTAYQPAGSYPESVRQVALSPTYSQDQTLFVDHYGLHRSDDGGDTWQALNPGTSGYGQDYLFLSPDYASSHGVYDLWVPGDAPGAARVYGSADRGNRWTDVGAGPPLEGYGDGRLIPAPGAIVYFAWTPYDAGQPAQLFRSGDIRPAAGKPAAVRWQRYSGPPLQAATPLELTADGTELAALDDEGTLLRWPVDSLSWVAAAGPTPPAATAPPQATGTPATPACAAPPDRFADVWQPVRDRLGCPKGPAAALQLAEQPFEHGRMIWESANRQIAVLLDDGTWQMFPDTWSEGVDPAWDVDLPPPPRQPQRGFGKVWREQLGGRKAAIGWALEGERSVNGWRLPFDGGLLLWTDALPPGVLPGSTAPGTAYLLYDDGTWEGVPAAP